MTAAEALRQRARELLERARTRGDVKRLCAELDREPALRAAVIEVGRSRGVDLPDGVVERWPAKRLLRVARGHEGPARERTNPIRRDEAFVCAHCGAEVPALHTTDRDHCPFCLRSLHVDRVPGDRADECRGILDPTGLELVGGHPVIHYVCRRCGVKHRVRAATSGTEPDRWEALVEISSRGGG